ncbi:ATP-binding protein [Streptomyces noursei]|uniref:ATP-binding protein n=1 Tax=Streptomyces noursei TaxID=1971 RepID=UPI0033C1EBDE
MPVHHATEQTFPPSALFASSADVALTSTPSSAANARRVVVAMVPENRELADRGQLLLSEAVTNVVAHTDSKLVRVFLSIDDHSGALLCGVFDTCARVPGLSGKPQDILAPVDEATEVAESGRGLALIDSLSDAWGFAKVSDGKWLWFNLFPQSQPEA